MVTNDQVVILSRNLRGVLMERLTGTSHARRMFDSDTASRAAGISLLELSEGSAKLEMIVSESMVNGYGVAHGGYVFLLADSAFACACNSTGQTTVAAGADVVFISPVRAGDRLLASAQERARFGRNGIYDVSVSRDGEAVAEFRGRSREIGEAFTAP